jgi:nitrilase
MPLSRTALYAQGEDLHVAVWPGGERSTYDITKLIAKESRSYVISVSGLMRKEDITRDLPQAELMIKNSSDVLANGGSCLAGPDGEWVIEPVVEKEDLLTAEIDHKLVREERQNFDPAGHYSRPDVTRLVVNKNRQQILILQDEDPGGKSG